MTGFIFDVNQRLTTSTSPVSAYTGGLPFDSSGGLVVANGTGAPTSFSNGIPFDGGAVAIDSTSAVANYMNGLPFTASGRLACSTSTPIDAFSNGFSFVGGKLCVTVAGSSAPNIQTIVSSAVADLDATVAASYTSGQTWANLVTSPADGTAQTAYDFWLGTDGSAGANDPTFSTNKFTFDGGDWFTIKANTALINNMHKTTGGGAWSACWILQAPAGHSQGYLGTNAFADSTTEGLSITNGTFFDYTNYLMLKGTGAGFAGTMGTSTGNQTSDGTMKFIAVTYDPSTGAVKTYVGNSTPVTFSSAFYISTANPTYPMQVGAAGNGVNPLASGAEVKAFSMYNAVLSDANVTALRAEYSTRHGASY